MILTKCAACATELGLTLGKKCGRCSTRYCGPACQKQHWEEGGHDQLCKPIKRAGGAEQHNANTRYTEAVAVAVEKCAEDTKGQTCYICTQALHWKTKEGLVRGCSCRGTAGFAHVSCLAEQAKILVAEALENNLSLNERWARWHSCGLCEQDYHGVVACALGWACWKTYVGRPESDPVRMGAMRQVANGLAAVDHDEDALTVEEAQLSLMRRLDYSEEGLLTMQENLAVSYARLGRVEEALLMQRGVYSGRMKLYGEEHANTLLAATNLAMSLLGLQRFEEVKALLRKTMPIARRVLGENDFDMLTMRRLYARALITDADATLDDTREAVNTLEDTERTARRVYGGAHPLTGALEEHLQVSRAVLHARASRDEV